MTKKTTGNEAGFKVGERVRVVGPFVHKCVIGLSGEIVKVGQYGVMVKLEGGKRLLPFRWFSTTEDDCPIRRAEGK